MKKHFSGMLRSNDFTAEVECSYFNQNEWRGVGVTQSCIEVGSQVTNIGNILVTNVYSNGTFVFEGMGRLHWHNYIIQTRRVISNAICEMCESRESCLSI